MAEVAHKVRIGFDWSGRSVKVVRVVVRGGSPRLTHAAAGPAQVAARAVEQARQKGISGRGAHVGAVLPARWSHLRQIDLPLQGEAELLATLPFEIRRHVPLPEDEELLLEHQVLDRLEESGRLSLLTAVQPKHDLLDHLDSLERAGLRPSRVEPAPLAALNHLHHLPGRSRPEAGWGVLDVGGGESSIALCRGSEAFYSRSFPIAGASFTQELVERCGLTREEAESVKKGDETLGRIRMEWRGRMVPITDLVRVSVNQLIDEVRSHIALYQQRHGPVRHLYLSGGGALLPGLDGVLERRLAIPVSLVDPFEAVRLPDRWTEEEKNVLLARAPRFLVAVGLTRWWESS